MMFPVTIIFAAYIALGASNHIIGGDGHPELMINASLNLDWKLYKERHDKQYINTDEEFHRRLAWEENLKIIAKHNAEYAAGKRSFKLGATKFADLTNVEYRTAIVMPKFDAARTRRPIGQNPGHTAKVVGPDAVDWREKGYVTPVKDNSQCGSWAFSATGAMEGASFKATGKLVSLSEQNLYDCSASQGTQGCHGFGIMDQAFQYVIKNKGIDTEESYPYEGRDGQCRYSKEHIGATISAYKDIESGSEDDLQSAIATVGPISVGIDAGQPSFQLYEEGVYDEEACSSIQIDHCVLVVGYGTADGIPYYIVKNSWGENWGLQGYIWMRRNKDNQCGIATLASYPIA